MHHHLSRSGRSFRPVWRIVGIAWLLWLILGAPAPATMVVPMTEEELATQADLVLTGQVKAIESQWDDQRRRIHTNISILVDDVLKGGWPGTEVTIRQLGGQIGEARFRVQGSPEFRRGESVLVFLRQRPDGTLRVAYLYQGKFSVLYDPVSGEDDVQREAPPDVTVMRRGAGAAGGPQGHQLRRRVRDLKAQIRSLGGGGRSAGPRGSGQGTAAGSHAGASDVTEVHDRFTYLERGPARWFEPDAEMPVPVHLNAAGEPRAPTGGFEQVRAALQAWSTVSGSSFRYQDAGLTAASGFHMDGVNVVSFGDPDGEIDAPSSCRGTVAVGGYFRSSSETRVVNGQAFYRILDGDLVIADGWQGCGVYETFENLAEVVTHELGHVLGLGHSADPNATMNAGARFDGRGPALTPDDVAGVRFIHPGPTAGVTASVSGNATPPQLPGTPITFTANPSGSPGLFEYKWWVFDGTGWTAEQGWDTGGAFVWTPPVPNAGYQVGVWVRSVGKPTDTPDADSFIPFPIAPAAR